MPLKESIAHARHLTRLLHESLVDDHGDAWEDLLARRADAMAEFQADHREASEAALAACGPDLEALAVADRELQRLAAEVLTAVAADVGDRLGAAPVGSSAYDDRPLQGAVNRRA